MTLVSRPSLRSGRLPNPPLRRSIRLGDVDVDAGADPDDGVRSGSEIVTPLALAADLGHLEITEILVAHGADASWTGTDVWTAVTYADAAGFHAVAARRDVLRAVGG
jgi:hypothetical protein